VQTLDELSDLLDRFGARLRYEASALGAELLLELAIARVQDLRQMTGTSRCHAAAHLACFEHRNRQPCSFQQRGARQTGDARADDGDIDVQMRRRVTGQEWTLRQTVPEG
jgi:hypothetical protein